MDGKESDSLFVEKMWLKHHNLVKWTTWKIVKKYGGDFDELFSEALVLFTVACQRYEPYVGTIQNWIGFSVYKGLLEIKRTEARRLNITGTMSDDLRFISSEPCPFEAIWTDLSDDSQSVLTLLFGLEGVRAFKNKSLAKLTLRTSLRTEKGWSNDKVNDCFREIEAAFN